MLEAELSAGRIRYRDLGEGPPIVFVHGVFVNSTLWRNVERPLAAAGFRCIGPDWPLGAHSLPMPPDADLTPHGVARLIGEFLDVLDLRDVTIVGNDTGGAITQLPLAGGCERIGRAELTPCDSFDNFLAAVDPDRAVPGPGAGCDPARRSSSSGRKGCGVSVSGRWPSIQFPTMSPSPGCCPC